MTFQLFFEDFLEWLNKVNNFLVNLLDTIIDYVFDGVWETTTGKILTLSVVWGLFILAVSLIVQSDILSVIGIVVGLPMGIFSVIACLTISFFGALLIISYIIERVFEITYNTIYK